MFRLGTDSLWNQQIFVAFSQSWFWRALGNNNRKLWSDGLVRSRVRYQFSANWFRCWLAGWQWPTDFRIYYFFLFCLPNKREWKYPINKNILKKKYIYTYLHFVRPKILAWPCFRVCSQLVVLPNEYILASSLYFVK